MSLVVKSDLNKHVGPWALRNGINAMWTAFYVFDVSLNLDYAFNTLTAVVMLYFLSFIISLSDWVLFGSTWHSIVCMRVCAQGNPHTTGFLICKIQVTKHTTEKSDKIIGTTKDDWDLYQGGKSTQFWPDYLLVCGKHDHSIDCREPADWWTVCTHIPTIWTSNRLKVFTHCQWCDKKRQVQGV